MRRETRTVFIADDGSEHEYESAALRVDRRMRLSKVMGGLPTRHLAAVDDAVFDVVLEWAESEIELELERTK